MENGNGTATLRFSDYAMIVNARDNVAAVKQELSPGAQIVLPDGRTVAITGTVTPGNRFATRAVPAGDFLLQYGQPIGTSLGIAVGDPVSHSNMSNDVPVVRELPEDLQTPPPNYFPELERGTFMGFRRADGRVGTRNFVLIVPTSMCASHEAQQISMISEFTTYKREKYPNVDGVVAIPHNKGVVAGWFEPDVMLRTLANYADHPNVGGVILIDLVREDKSGIYRKFSSTRSEIQQAFRPIGIRGRQRYEAYTAWLREVELMLPK
jgi:altronate hydrolase